MRLSVTVPLYQTLIPKFCCGSFCETKHSDLAAVKQTLAHHKWRILNGFRQEQRPCVRQPENTKFPRSDI